MKIFYFLLLLCGAFLPCYSQIQVTPYLPDEMFEKNPAAAELLEKKLTNIVSANKIQSTMGDSRFVLTGNWYEVSKDVLGTVPVKIAYTLEVHLYIGDGITGTKYISNSFKLKGVGATEEKAYLNAVRNLQATSTKMSAFINEGRARVIAYYNENEANILSQIKSVVTKQNYEEAAYLLSLIPMECSYYQKVQSLISDIYQKIIDDKANVQLTEAKALWAASQDEATANQIVDLVSQINPDATCYDEVQKLLNTINKKINTIQDRRWEAQQQEKAHEREMEKRNLEAEREERRLNAEVTQTRIKAEAEVERNRLSANAQMEVERQKTLREQNEHNAKLASKAMDTYSELESKKIDAVREIGVAYAKNQPKSISYNVHKWY